MSFIEGIRVGAERVAAGLGAEIDRPAARREARKIRGVGVVEDPPAESDETWLSLLPSRLSENLVSLVFHREGREDR